MLSLIAGSVDGFVNQFENSRLLRQSPVSSPETATSAIGLGEAVAMIVGLVIGAGIFETPALVAANLGSGVMVLLVWLVGGGVSLVGALCYAELATTYPHRGGNYYYLKRAYGSSIAFLFAWARMTVIQTGSIALLAFVFGDYATQLWPIAGTASISSSIYAAVAVVLLTGLNLVGLQQGTQTQNWLTAAKVVGLLLVIGVGLAAPQVRSDLGSAGLEFEALTGSGGLALLFVLLSYGGWNEAAYISAEIRHRQRNIVRSLYWSIGIITAIYGLINWAYLHGLGLTAMAQSQAVAADLLRQVLGEPGAVFVSLLIAVSTLGAINATLFTGARTNYALGQDFTLFHSLGHWQSRSNAPRSAFGVQAAITLALIGLGTLTRRGFETMVDYTAPVFWFFFLLSGLSLFVLRIREPGIDRPFRVPYYPLLPLIFCGVCGYLLYASLAYTGWGAIVAIGVVGLGVPLLLWERDRAGR